MRNKKQNLGAWTLWSDKAPTIPGHYWLAGYWPGTKDGPASTEPEEPVVVELDADDFARRMDVVNLHGYEAKNLLWCGPIPPPPFGTVV